MSVIRRPAGITVIAVIWALGGLINIGGGLLSLSGDIEGLSLLNGSGLDPWFNFAIPIELIISIIIMMVGLMQLIGVAGLWSGKKYAYKIALALPIMSIITNLSLAILYSSAPTAIEYIFSNIIYGVGGAIFWLVIYFAYFNKQHVKIWLKVVAAPAQQPYYAPMQYPPANPAPYAMQQPVFQHPRFCTYCGAETPDDIAFCGRCGKQLKQETQIY
jgi:hypothetical protein